jgi:hypothetical protein
MTKESAKVTYREPKPITREDAAKVFETDDVSATCEALLDLTYFDSDWRWLIKQCEGFARHKERAVRSTAAVCLGHIVRLHGPQALAGCKKILEELLKDKDVAPYAQDAIDYECKMFGTHA